MASRAGGGAGYQWSKYSALHVLPPDDPYYCGLRARIPNFAKSKAQKEKEAKYGRIGERRDKEGHPMVWHGPQRGYGPDGINLQAPAGHPDPIYAGFRSRPEDRGPRGRPGHHRGGEVFVSLVEKVNAPPLL